MDPGSDDFLVRADRELLGAWEVEVGVARGDRVGRIFLGGGWVTEADRDKPRFLGEGSVGAVEVDRVGPCFAGGPDRAGDRRLG